MVKELVEGSNDSGVPENEALDAKDVRNYLTKYDERVLRYERITYKEDELKDGYS